MFLEISKVKFDKLKESLDSMNISYELSDCTLEGEKEISVHAEFLSELSDEQKRIINDRIDEIYGEGTIERSYEKDMDGDGIPDIVEEKEEKEAERPKERRRRPWDDKVHTPSESMKGYFTGEIEKEDVIYE